MLLYKRNNKPCVGSKANKGLQRWTELSKHGQYWIRMFVPAVVSGAIMGKHGRIIKSLEKESGAGIRLFSGDQNLFEEHVRSIAIVANSIDSLREAVYHILQSCIIPNIRSGRIHLYVPNWASLNLALHASRSNSNNNNNNKVVPLFPGFLVTFDGVGLRANNISEVACAIQADVVGVTIVRLLSRGLFLKGKGEEKSPATGGGLQFSGIDEIPVEVSSQSERSTSFTMVFELHSLRLKPARMHYMGELINSCIPEVNTKCLLLSPTTNITTTEGDKHHWAVVLSSHTLGAIHFVHRVFQHYADN